MDILHLAFASAFIVGMVIVGLSKPIQYKEPLIAGRKAARASIYKDESVDLIRYL